MHSGDLQVEKNECPWHWKTSHEGYCPFFFSVSHNKQDIWFLVSKWINFWSPETWKRKSLSVKVCLTSQRETAGPEYKAVDMMLLLASTSRRLRCHHRFVWDWRLSASLIVSSDFQLNPELNPMCHFQVLIMILMRGCFAWSPLSRNQCFSSLEEVMTVRFQSRQTAILKIEEIKYNLQHTDHQFLQNRKNRHYLSAQTLINPIIVHLRHMTKCFLNLNTYINALYTIRHI